MASNTHDIWPGPRPDLDMDFVSAARVVRNERVWASLLSVFKFMKTGNCAKMHYQTSFQKTNLRYNIFPLNVKMMFSVFLFSLGKTEPLKNHVLRFLFVLGKKYSVFL
jgi:hypothetical protein